MQLFDKKVLLGFTLVFSGWMQTTIVNAKEIAMAKCPDPATISEGKLLAEYAVKCAETALDMLKVDPDASFVVKAANVVKAAELTIKSLDFLEKADNQDADVDDAEEKYDEALAETRKKLREFLDPQQKDSCKKVLNKLSELDELPSEVKETACDGGRATNPSCKRKGGMCICPRRQVRKSTTMKAKCDSLGDGNYECYGVCP